MKTGYTTQQLARRLGVTTRTLHYYEEIGLGDRYVRQSQSRVKNFTRDDWQRNEKESGDVCRQLAAFMQAGQPVDTAPVAALVDRHYQGIRLFWDCPLDGYRCLGQTYVDDPRFTAFYDRQAPGLAVYLRDAIAAYCKRRRSA